MRFGYSENKPEKNIFAVRTDQLVKIDGLLNENVWKTSDYVSGFTQLDPNEGKTPTEKTIVWIAYDDQALYIAARMYDSSPDSIYANLVRRDENSNSDRFTVYIDSYNDKRSGNYFGITAAGTLADGVLYNDEWDDITWDGVWEGKSKIDKEGWTAEIKIPFSQLKFKSNNIQTWGIDFKRDIARNHERDYLVYIPKNESGFVSRFANLNGIKNIKPADQLEILPYVTSKASYTAHDLNDPFNNGSKYTAGFGADVKYGIGSNLTLNASINPDFGQVEIDPAVINLSDVETFYDEKRPFFVEGSSIFNFGYGGSRSNWGFNWGSPDFFYSRRIGRTPQGSTPDADYTNYPDGTHILGAAKLTGKIDDNINLGVIQAVTQREYADLSINKNRSSAEVEPLSYYGIFRAQKDINEGAQGLGFISTITKRSFKDNRLKDEINSGAYTGGIDGWTFLDSDKEYVLTGWGGMSYVNGTQQRILDLQQNSQHYFQRPDSKTLKLDSTATSLSGYAGRLTINKQKGNVFLNTALGAISPGFDVNDLGFLWRTNIINYHFVSGYNWREPTDWYRSLQLGGAVFRSYNFDGQINWQGLFSFMNMTTLNYFDISMDGAYNPRTINDRGTRGGPVMLNLPGYQFDIYSNTDTRNNFVFSAGYNSYIQENNSKNWGVSVGVDYRPVANVLISIIPNYSKNIDNSQYIDTFTDPLANVTYGKRYVFGELNQTTLSAGIRLNWTFTPNLSLQFYAQPLISTGKYARYKELAEPGTYNFNVYGENGSTYNNETHLADPDGNGPAEPVDLGDNDFKFVSLRGNAVLRWEYLPGSVVYFVWTQTRSESYNDPEFQFGRVFTNLTDLHPDNIFLIKMTYWLNM
jgi:hypothetical protein